MLDSDVLAIDPRTEHEARPVGAGALKFAANFWLHLYDFREPYTRSCTG